MRLLIKIIPALAILFLWHPQTVNADEIPDIGSPHSKYFSPQQEAEIGRQMMQQVKESAALITDPEINTYIQSLGNSLVNYANENNLPEFTFFIIASDQINAFAAPGGYIGIFTGLINATKTESELASVLAHEIGHITQSHLARRIAEHERLSVPRIAALLASILIATQDSQAGSAALISTNAASIQHQLAYSRTAEKEADNIGLKILAASGYDQKGMTGFFQTLQDAQTHSNKPIEYLSTHPLTQSRISEVKSRINHQYKWMGKESINYILIKTKLDIYSINDPQKALEKYQRLITTDSNFSNHYGYALALIKSGRYKKAEQIILKLISDDTERIAYLIALGKSQLQQKKIKNCYTTYQKALQIYPDNYPLIHNYAVALLYSSAYADGLKLVQQKLNLAKQHPELYKLAADLASKKGHKWLGHEYIGDYYRFNFYQAGVAREHYKKALTAINSISQELPNKKVIISRVEAKIEAINKLERKLQKQ
ncbi:MAG: M48 family peptidase [Gammaproteobacteria bacterium]|nr:MAG: M48 family peptidase [Gammaproteobacteria bacterium]